ncbi:conserved hypothetical protein [Tenacibaculum mesophilum]|uniref:PA2169 family four-helix-bundle protein n=2 Tax=Tenacibaculum TaxID=104267 RepID=A0ABM7CDF0_9FLAO|nr:PA2169 family four-helix-bundle protein [Tenacibaculum mesophilum]AZJ31744.1 PA2169 family four-helix-bundle protein [Tenacibaculum mesophilum]QFS26998.1 PA2169 family four-helix-bundle protein [Tenacibaculum mesophilum]SHG03783.1 conserved hypothetical protein [Tenacibaculum mesophilum]
MYSYTEEVSNKLNGLLEKNYDAAKGYKTAAENVNSETLTNLFVRKANEREMFGKQLKSEIKSFGQSPEKGGSLKGTAHRAWMNTKAFFSNESEEAILEEALRGEKASLEEYNEVINSEEHLPNSTTNLLKSQRDIILNDAILVKELEKIK